MNQGPRVPCHPYGGELRSRAGRASSRERTEEHLTAASANSPTPPFLDEKPNDTAELGIH